MKPTDEPDAPRPAPQPPSNPPSPPPAPTPSPQAGPLLAPNTFRIHFLVKDDAGPLQSQPVPGVKFLGQQIGTESRWRFACDPELQMDALNRGSPDFEAVRCQACRDSEAYKPFLGRPKRGSQTQDLVSEP